MFGEDPAASIDGVSAASAQAAVSASDMTNRLKRLRSGVLRWYVKDRDCEFIVSLCLDVSAVKNAADSPL